MDVVTQGLLGGVLAQSAARKEERKAASVIGILAGMLADADILIRSSVDPLLTIEYHRHFSHSLFFIPIGALIAFLLLWPFIRHRLSAWRLYFFCLLGYSMSGVLDAFTSYGTHLLWPLSEQRISFNIISIIDPVFTVILLVTFILGLRLQGQRTAVVGLLLCVAYLGLGFLQLQRAQEEAHNLAAMRGHVTQQHVVKPTLANMVLWRSVYIANERIHVDALRVGLTGSRQVFAGESVPLFQLPRNISTSVLKEDIQRFTVFSDGYVGLDPEQENVLGDIRYSMLPVSARPLWGIIIDTTRPQQHAEYRFFRNNSEQVRKTFLNLLLGRCASAICS